MGVIESLSTDIGKVGGWKKDERSVAASESVCFGS